MPATVTSPGEKIAALANRPGALADRTAEMITDADI
jgi:hypothetical protein